jgi:ATP-dependent HslUV protease ATP-binding subunit HslU
MHKTRNHLTTMTPREIVQELDRHIIGQHAPSAPSPSRCATAGGACSLRSDLRNEVMPKNILMIGPTGVGKTEIARRLATLANAPFVKVEATRFTEVGYVGKDVEQIVRDLADTAVKLYASRPSSACARRPEERAEERILDALLPRARACNTVFGFNATRPPRTNRPRRPIPRKRTETRAKLRKQLRSGALDEREIEIEAAVNVGVDIMAPPGMEEMGQQLRQMFSQVAGAKTHRKTMTISTARTQLTEEEAGKLVNEDDVREAAIEACEQHGIVFIDEIDKVAKRSETIGGGDVSREGVQRDLLPLVEGSTVSTKYGPVNTDHILFIASGAFHLAKPSDLIPGTAGPLPDPGGTGALSQGRLRAHPHRAQGRADHAVRRAAEDRRRDRDVRADAVDASPTSPRRSTSARRTSARAACTPCWNACSTRSATRRRTVAAQRHHRPRLRRRAPRRLVQDPDLSRYIL